MAWFLVTLQNNALPFALPILSIDNIGFVDVEAYYSTTILNFTMNDLARFPLMELSTVLNSLSNPYGGPDHSTIHYNLIPILK